jgi:hypothetical protein
MLLAAGLYTRAFRSGWRPNGTLWVTATHHISFSLGFALQQLGYRIINNLVWEKPAPVPNALHTAFTHLKAVEPVPAGASPAHPRGLKTVGISSEHTASLTCRVCRSPPADVDGGPLFALRLGLA